MTKTVYDLMGYVMSFESSRPKNTLGRVFILPSLAYLNMPSDYAGHKTNYICLDIMWLRWIACIEINILKK